MAAPGVSMRCTRCDKIAVPQAVGLTRDGLVVFGWCLECLAQEECVLVEIPGDGPLATRAFRRRRRRLAARRRSRIPRARRSRRLALTLVAAIMAGWAALLTICGAVLVAYPLQPPRRLSAPMLLTGAILVAATSLALWLATLDRRRRFLVLLQVVQVAAAVVAFGALIRGIARYDFRRNVPVVGVALAAFAVSWAARWAERRRQRLSPARPETIRPDL